MEIKGSLELKRKKRKIKSKEK